jgi:DNA polymerase
MTNPQRLLFLDFETYYDQEYSLTKMSPPNYILNPRFETIGCAAKEGLDGLTQWIDGPGFPSFIAQYDQRCTTTVTFNALFDNCILAWVYGFVPARVLCAMRMAVALRGHILPSASLASVTRCLKLGSKGTAIENVKGMRRAEIMNIPSLWNAFQSYAINDCDLCAKIFATLAPEFPTSERRVMDAVLRCAIEPKFHIDTEMLSQHLKDLEDDKIRMLRLANGANEEDLDEQGFVLHDEQAMFERMGDFASNLRSNDKFAALLEARGVDIEYKQSLSDPNREIPAFAKTDEFMSDLLEHEDPVVQALAAARLGVRSTIEQTRGARILSIAGLPWHCYRDGSPRLYSGGTMPIPLRYSGAHTHRLSGDWKINMQNLPAGRGKNKSKLRKALIAPPGHEVVVADLSQIECRITAWLCGETALLNTFVQDGDPYSVLAGKIFGFKVDKKVHLIERFIGKWMWRQEILQHGDTSSAQPRHGCEETTRSVDTGTREESCGRVSRR